MNVFLKSYPNPKPVFSEIKRVLNQGGQFYLADYTTRNEYILSFGIGKIKFYSPEQQEQLGNEVGLKTVGHYHLVAGVLLTIFDA